MLTSAMPIAVAVVAQAWNAVSRSCTRVRRCFVPGKRFTELLCGPGGRGLVGDGDVHYASTLMREDQQHEQESACGRRYDEDIGRRDLLDVIRQERAPRL